MTSLPALESGQGGTFQTGAGGAGRDDGACAMCAVEEDAAAAPVSRGRRGRFLLQGFRAGSFWMQGRVFDEVARMGEGEA